MKQWMTKKQIRNFCIALFVACAISLWLPSLQAFVSQNMTAPQRRALIPHNTAVAIASPAETFSSETFSSETAAALRLVQLGQQYYNQEQFAAAAQALGQAATLYNERGASLQQAQALSLQSLAWQKLGQWDAAKRAIAQSLALSETAPLETAPLETATTTAEYLRIRGQILNTQGHLNFGLGQSERALDCWRFAEAVYRQADIPDAILGSQINQAQALQSLGFYRRAETLLKDLQETLNDLSETPLKVKGLLNLGNALRLEGEIERAQALLNEGLAVAQRLQLPREEGQALLSLGNTERVRMIQAATMRELEDSEKYCQLAQRAYQQAQQISPDLLTRVQAQFNQLSLSRELARLGLALENSTSEVPLKSQLRRALSQLPVSRASIYARVNLAQYDIDSLREPLTALASADNKTRYQTETAPAIAQQLALAVQNAQILEDKRAESYALGALGHLYEALGDRANATIATGQALSIAQSIRAPDIAYQWQWQLGRLRHSIADYTAAVTTLKALRSDLVALNPDIQFSFRDRVEPVYRELVALLLHSDSPSIEHLKQARDVMEFLQLAEIDNYFRDACADPDTIDIEAIDPTAAVVYPIVLEDRLAVILKLPGTDNLRYYATRGVSEANIDTTLKQLLGNIKRRSTPPAVIQADAQQLYHWLLAPFEKSLDYANSRAHSQIKTLVFVLDGALANLPVSALYDGQHYLIERYALAITPGLQLLAPQRLRPDNLRVLIAGATYAPSFEAAKLNSLNNVAFEIDGIAAQVEQVTRLENEQFLQATLREQIKTTAFNVVHLATHGNFSSNPEETFLLDWRDRISANDIDTLFEVDTPSRENAIELLVLSACETAAGDKRAALGLAGTAIRANVRSTLATLWQVNDRSIADFMVRFYEQLSQNGSTTRPTARPTTTPTVGPLTKAEALRNTQLSFLKDSPDTDYNRPFHWATFTLVGNWL